MRTIKTQKVVAPVPQAFAFGHQHLFFLGGSSADFTARLTARCGGSFASITLVSGNSSTQCSGAMLTGVPSKPGISRVVNVALWI